MSYRCRGLWSEGQTWLVIAAASTLFGFCLLPQSSSVGQQPSTAVVAAADERLAATGPQPNAGPTDEQIQQLTQLLQGSRWTGRFTTLGPDGQIGAAADESYEISEAKKLPAGADGADGANANLWLLTTRIKYGKRDLTVPLPIEIQWAGGTPVITVDQLLIPGLGTFDARVLIRRGRYSGTWSHNKVGGHLFGVIGRADATDKVE